MSIRQNIESIRKRIQAIAIKSGHNPEDIIIVCITKNRSVKEIYQVLDTGITHIGENKVQEAEQKYLAISEYTKQKIIPLNFHMIGHLQTNKVKKALEMFNMIQSVDSFRLAEKINEVSKNIGKTTDILIEVKTSKEESTHSTNLGLIPRLRSGWFEGMVSEVEPKPEVCSGLILSGAFEYRLERRGLAPSNVSKFGVGIDEAIPFLRQLQGLDNIRIRGLMTMAPLVSDKEKARPYFRRSRQLKEEINKIDEPLFKKKIKMDFLSMGMSQDYEVAVEEGANMLRIGTAIFK